MNSLFLFSRNGGKLYRSPQQWWSAVIKELIELNAATQRIIGNLIKEINDPSAVRGMGAFEFEVLDFGLIPWENRLDDCTNRLNEMQST